MANQLNCLRCGTGMQFIRREKFQLGQTGWVLGDLPNLFAGAMEIEIYVCPKCGKLEFFQPGSDKPVFHLSAPYMTDAAGQMSYAVSVAL